MAGVYAYKDVDVVYRVYIMDEFVEDYTTPENVVIGINQYSKWSLFKSIKFMDILPSEININFFEPNKMKISLQNIEIFEELYNIYSTNWLLFERVIFNEPNNVDEFNKFFFVNKFNFDLQNSEYVIEGNDWKWFEQFRIVQHNKYYNSADYWNGSTGEYTNIPDDQNTINNSTRTQKQLLDYLINRCFFNPLYHMKGRDPTDTYTATNGINYFEKILWLESINVEDYAKNDKYTFTLEKQNFFEVKRKIYEFYGVEDFAVHNVEMALLNGKVKVFYKINQNLIIDNFYTRDQVVNFKFEIDDQKTINTCKGESDSEDFNAASLVRNNSQNQMVDSTKFARKHFTEIAKTTIPQDEISNGGFDWINGVNAQKINENSTKKTYGIEIEFAEKLYLRDFNVCDIVTLTNFNNLINGDYLIKEISEIIEDNYISYAITDMQKMEE